MTIHSAQYKNEYINSHSAKQNLKHKRNCYSYHSSYKRSVTPFCFQLLTIISSFIGTQYEHRQLRSCLPQCEYPNECCHTDYQLYKSFDSQTWCTFLSSILLSILHVHPWYSDLSLRPWVLDVIECLDIFVCFSLSSRTSPFRKHSVWFFSVGLPRTVYSFVNLRHDNILQQYINTFLETVLPNFIQSASSCPLKNFGSNEIQIVPHWIIQSTKQNRPILK